KLLTKLDIAVAFIRHINEPKIANLERSLINMLASGPNNASTHIFEEQTRTTQDAAHDIETNTDTEQMYTEEVQHLREPNLAPNLTATTTLSSGSTDKNGYDKEGS
ncbi:MAG: hypothetical protein ACKPKO_53960, partial [Candidatus Fonsibacter sp.]